MISQIKLSRRQMLCGAASLPALSALPAIAEAPMLGTAIPQYSRVKLGGFEVTTLLAGSRPVEEPQGIFGMNVSADEFAEVSAAHNIPTDVAQFYFTPTLVNTGQQLVMFDAGLSAEGTGAALAAAGYTPDQVDVMVITHMHGDHIGGLRSDAGDTFPNASYVTGQVEYDHWAGAENEGFEGKVRPLADRMNFVAGGDSVASGITAHEAFGHTPGHMGYMIESDGKQLFIMADLANHYVWSLAYPDWEVRFDRDKAAAAASRRQVLGMLATDNIPLIGYHMPFPATGYVETRGDGFHYVPTSYQLVI